jgi:hypothetical protein
MIVLGTRLAMNGQERKEYQVQMIVEEIQNPLLKGAGLMLANNKNMKKIFLASIILTSVVFLSGCSSDPAVKKSNTSICHKKGTNFYNNTKNFTAYDSIEKCLNSGGRLPKK